MAIDSTEAGDAGNSHSSSKDFKQPAWFTPERLLAILCCINMLNYLDRGAIASNGVNGLQANTTCAPHSAGSSTTTISCNEASGIVGDFSLSYFQDGILSSAFMVGLLIASPIFAELSKSFNPMRLIGVGLSVWTVATAGCAASFDFWSIAFFRALVGVAEASFISLAAPFIDDYAPPGRRTAWLSLFYSCIPVGIAAGYVYGGLVGSALGWRAAFWIESLFMLPFAVFGFISKPVLLKRAGHDHHKAILKDADGGAGRSRTAGDNDSGPGLGLGFGSYLAAVGEQGLGIWRDIKKLAAQKAYMFNVVGYVAYTFVVGAYAYWGPKVGEVLFDLPNADLVFGGTTIVSGIFGTLFGGFALDRLGSTINTAFKFIGVSCAIGGVLCLIAFSVSSLYWFIPLFAIGEFAVFAIQGPVNFVTLHSVEPQDRPMAIALSTVAIHIFGDVPSSPLVGEFEDLIDNWRLTSQLLTSGLLVAAAVWGSGSLVAPQGREEEGLLAGDGEP